MLESIFTSVYNALLNAFNWVISAVRSIGDSAILWIMGLLPADPGGPASVVLFGLDCANAWAPLSEIIGFSSIALTFVVSFLAAKILLKLIP